jgi:hypothetical protein
MSQEHSGFFIDTRQGVIDDATEFYEWQLLRSFIGLDIYWHAHSFGSDDLPPGHRGYIVKVEGHDLDWLLRQSRLVDAPIFVLNGCVNPGDFFDSVASVHWLPWVDWHYHLRAMLHNFSPVVTKQLTKKISSLVRISKPNKMIALAAVKKYHSHDSIVSLNENLHWRTYLNNSRTGHSDFDALLKEVDTYAGECQYIDDVSTYQDNNTLLHIKLNDFHHPAYQCCAINVTNESFYNSDGWEANGRCFTYPGPFLTEKTLKCLLGETAFIANGQFQTYSTLRSLGFEFDYGLDLSYDNVKPDLERLIAMFGLIQSLQSLDTMEIFENTRNSCLHNKEHVLSGKFYSISEKINQETVQYIYSNI